MNGIRKPTRVVDCNIGKVIGIKMRHIFIAKTLTEKKKMYNNLHYDNAVASKRASLICDNCRNLRNSRTVPARRNCL